MNATSAPLSGNTLAAHTTHPGLFREYDIRGIVGETLFDADAYAIGRAYAETLPRTGNSAPRICVGYDGRISSPALEAELVRGLRDGGCHVLRIGCGPTPMLYFTVFHADAAGGIMVTGSHNPPKHNGFKLMRGKDALYGAEIQALGARVHAGFAAPQYSPGTIETLAIQPIYEAALLAALPANARPLTVAWDAGNGAAGEIMATLCRTLPGRHIALNAVIDGTFPAHHPDPSVAENMQQLITTVARERCDLGIAFDGDGDRIGVVDDQGRILWGDELMVVFARAILAERPGATIIADVKASRVLFDAIRNAGGTPLMWKTGHSLVKAKMKELGAPFAGEMSGHIFFADHYYGIDDGLYAAVRLLGVLSQSDRPLSALLKDLPVMINTPELRFPCDDSQKFAVVEAIKSALTRDGKAFNGIDGVRVESSRGWWLLRASNTQAVLVARAEAANQADLDALRTELASYLAACGIALPSESTAAHH